MHILPEGIQRPHDRRLDEEWLKRLQEGLAPRPVEFGVEAAGFVKLPVSREPAAPGPADEGLDMAMKVNKDMVRVETGVGEIKGTLGTRTEFAKHVSDKVPRGEVTVALGGIRLVDGGVEIVFKAEGAWTMVSLPKY